MAKDPAFLFYPGDWLGGTMAFTFEEKGAYLELLILQFNQGTFTEAQAKHMLSTCSANVWHNIKHKFSKEGDNFYQDRLRTEIEKRKAFSKSRRDNALGKKDEEKQKAYAKHMEDENENINENKDKSFDFEFIWKQYPKPIGKKQALKHFTASVKSDDDFANIQRALDNYKKSDTVSRGFVQNGSTWFNNWQDWIPKETKPERKLTLAEKDALFGEVA